MNTKVFVCLSASIGYVIISDAFFDFSASLKARAADFKLDVKHDRPLNLIILDSVLVLQYPHPPPPPPTYPYAC